MMAIFTTSPQPVSKGEGLPCKAFSMEAGLDAKYIKVPLQRRGVGVRY